MKNKIIDEFEKSMCKETDLNFNVGDIVSVYKTIFEGKKQRVQRFQGTVIMIKGSLSRKSFTVRKISSGSGVEKTFLYHSPLIKNIDVIQIYHHVFHRLLLIEYHKIIHVFLLLILYIL